MNDGERSVSVTGRRAVRSGWDDEGGPPSPYVQFYSDRRRCYGDATSRERRRWSTVGPATEDSRLIPAFPALRRSSAPRPHPSCTVVYGVAPWLSVAHTPSQRHCVVEERSRDAPSAVHRRPRPASRDARAALQRAPDLPRNRDGPFQHARERGWTCHPAVTRMPIARHAVSAFPLHNYLIGHWIAHVIGHGTSPALSCHGSA